ncbi:MAG: branched-chain amino acid transaminase [Chloroflexi bacterium]|nr:branched-chain amino acid transaminase [Chloroflexota bacterium]
MPPGLAGARPPASDNGEVYVTTGDPKAFAQTPPEHPPYLWWAGRQVPWESATVHVTQVGWTAISAVFEGIRAYWNEERQELNVFRLEEHLKRFAQSIRFMRMAQTYSPQQLTQAIRELFRANGLREDAYCQPLAYMGRSVPGYLAADDVPSEVFITTRAAPSNLGSARLLHCCVSSWVRISDNVMPPRAKAITNYQNSRYVSNEARINGYDAGIILNDQGKVAEGAYACIVIVRDGVAATPPRSAGILESITLASVLELLGEMGVPVEVRDIDRTELYVADEAFLCGTLIEIAPIGSVDRYQVGDGAMGPVTRALEERFTRVVRGQDPGRSHWLTPVHESVGVGPR